MRIDPLTSDATTATSSGALTPSTDEFLRLFVAQLENQDPLDPKDPSEMVAQLGQLTQVQETVALGTRLDAIAAQQSSATRASLLGLFGRTVDAPAAAVTIADAAAPLPVVAELGGPVTRATVTIRDAAGQVVKTIELGPQAGGQVPLWGDAGPGLPAGTYQLEIAAVAASGAAVTAAPVIHGAITSIGFGADGATLRVGGLVLNPADIASVS